MSYEPAGELLPCSQFLQVCSEGNKNTCSHNPSTRPGPSGEFGGRYKIITEATGPQSLSLGPAV